jgi:isopentenyldiphosphate isomerase
MDENLEILEVVNRRNQRVGLASRGSIHRYGLQHRGVHVLVFDPSGRLYLQYRHHRKSQYPRHWDSSAAGHVNPGEDYATAAAREVAEELGLHLELWPVADVSAAAETSWEHVRLFQAITAVEPWPNPAEIEAGHFFTPAELHDLLHRSDAAVTPSFRLLYRVWRQQVDGS